jgi:hypothetical protein
MFIDKILYLLLELGYNALLYCSRQSILIQLGEKEELQNVQSDRSQLADKSPS